ncbi:MAG: hypothetical protein ACRELG_02875 [Gemmataceae bacterium]
MRTSSHLPSTRVRRLALGLLLLAVPACGLSDYEARMYDSQKREERFKEEQKYLDKPVETPTRKVQTDQDKEGHEVMLAMMFFRPPKGIGATPKPRDNLIWQYSAVSTTGDFYEVHMAFADEDDKDFANKVVGKYPMPAQPRQEVRQFLPPGQETPQVFDTWEFASGQVGYSVNILRSNRPIAIVYIYNKVRYESAGKAIKVSLQALAVEGQAGAARERYSRQSPWKLEKESDS